ncbi:MAG: phosphocholine cytidylyltransferase family protein [Candidatus Korarchaeota archaeon]|nr:phosphocholine cytidylyltransferase family protein [Thermoproteota archaeon]
MRAIILVAGLGKRLRPLTNDVPKALLKLKEGVRIIDLICCNLLSAGIRNITMVVGHASEAIREYVSNNSIYAKFDSIQYVENKEFETTNTGVSLYIALRSLSEMDDIVVVNGDIVFDYRVLEKLIQTSKTAIVIDNFKTLTKESFKVLIKGNIIVDMGKDISIESSSGEYIGLAKICREDLELAISILEQIIRKDKNAYYDLLFRELSRIREVDFVFTGGLLWTEVDFIDDLEYAQRLVTENLIHLGSFCSRIQVCSESG